MLLVAVGGGEGRDGVGVAAAAAALLVLLCCCRGTGFGGIYPLLLCHPNYDSLLLAVSLSYIRHLGTNIRGRKKCVPGLEKASELYRERETLHPRRDRADRSTGK